LGQARIILEQIYVHHDVKLRDFGSEADPTPALNEIEANIEKLSTMDFHKKMSDIFYRLRDLHTLYFLPQPYSCYSTLLPFLVQEVKLPDGKKVAAISEVDEESEAFKFMPKPFPIHVGDIVTKYDGVEIETAIRNQMVRSFGANPEASRRYSFELIRFKEQSLEFLPEKDTVKLELKNDKGESYNVTVPWVSRINKDCLAEAQTPELLRAPVLRTKKFDVPAKPVKRPTKTTGLRVLQQGDSADPILSWSINKNEFGNYGYIYLSSFTPEVLTIDQVVEELKTILLQDEMKQTNGLVFDMRGNGGGQLPLAEKIIQFFGPKRIQPELLYLKNSPANLYYLNTLFPNDPFTGLINEAEASGQAFTKLLPMTREDRINDLGQFYFKPMAVFTDATCYSACETFSAMIQDYQIGTIFGEESTTGGGGANTFGLNALLGDFEDRTDLGPFHKLPYGQNMTFAWREGVRGGINKGGRIENTGVKADQISYPSMSDLFNRYDDQLRVVHQYLRDQAPNYQSQIYLQNEERQDFVVGEIPQFKASWKATDSITFKENGAIVETRAIPSEGTNAVLKYPSDVETKSISQGRFEMTGQKNEKDVWRKVLNYRVVPPYKKLTGNYEPDLNAAGDVVTYTTTTKAADGWILAQNALTLGTGNDYADDVRAEASLFVTLPDSSYQLSFDAAIDTEDLDVLSVVAISEGKTTVLFKALSGSLPTKHYQVSLKKFAKKNVEIRFTFNSDSEYGRKGIQITRLKIGR